MAESDPYPNDPDAIDVRQLANAVRFFFFAIVLGLACISLNASQAIDGFGRIFMDMLGGKPLPMITQIVLSGRTFFVVVSLLLAAVAVGTLFTRRVVVAIYVLAAIGFVAIAETGVLYVALSIPFYEIIKAMGQGPA